MQSVAEMDRELAELMSVQNGGDTLHSFIAKQSPTFGPPPWTEVVTNLYDRARLERVFACLSVPPRHGKTYSTLHALAKWIRDFKRDTSAYSTYNDDRAKSKSRVARDLARRAGVPLSSDMANLGEWRRVEGGGLLAGGVASGLTGEGISGVLVVDDPFKDRREADSALRRQQVWEWFNSAAFTRLEGASVVVIQTRWHDDDLVGRLAKQGDWEVINIPAIAGDNDPLGRSPGDPLDPVAFPRAELDRIRGQIGEFEWAALYQGNPQPRGSKVFGSPTLYDPSAFVIDGWRVIIGVDPAATASTTADFSVAVALAFRGRWPEVEVRILDVLRDQCTVPDFVDKLAQFQRGWFHAPVAVEAAGGFKAVPQMLTRLNPGLVVLEVPPRGDKFTRAQPVAAAWKRGAVQCPSMAPWMPEFLEEVDKFTGVNDAHDDQVDALAHAYNAIAYAPAPIRRGARLNPGRFSR